MSKDPRKENNFTDYYNCRFQTEMATKRQSVWTSSLNYKNINIKSQGVLLRGSADKNIWEPLM